MHTHLRTSRPHSDRPRGVRWFQVFRLLIVLPAVLLAASCQAAPLLQARDLDVAVSQAALLAGALDRAMADPGALETSADDELKPRERQQRLAVRQAIRLLGWRLLETLRAIRTELARAQGSPVAATADVAPAMPAPEAPVPPTAAPTVAPASR